MNKKIKLIQCVTSCCLMWSGGNPMKKRLKSLEEETSRLKKLLAKAMLDKKALQAALGLKF